MGMKHLVGWGLLIWGALGAYNQYTLYQAASTATPSATSMFNSIDPATLFKIPPASGLFTAPLLTDLGVMGVGAWLAFT